MNQSVCHHLITKKLPHWHYANNTRFNTFGGVYPSEEAEVTMKLQYCFVLFVNAQLDMKP